MVSGKGVFWCKYYFANKKKDLMKDWQIINIMKNIIKSGSVFVFFSHRAFD